MAEHRGFSLEKLNFYGQKNKIDANCLTFYTVKRSQWLIVWLELNHMRFLW